MMQDASVKVGWEATVAALISTNSILILVANRRNYYQRMKDETERNFTSHNCRQSSMQSSISAYVIYMHSHAIDEVVR